MSGIFKAYDIRGIYPADLDAAMAEAIGRAFVTFTGARKIVVGRDMRPHSDDLFQGLARGLTGQGQSGRMERFQALPRRCRADQRRHRHRRYPAYR